jgi:phage tail protein/putative fels-1 prophage host specificity protein|nr:MAG TPA: tail protein [Caudoviricetes sp.]
MGKGGGGGGHTPVEAKESGRSKQLVKIVEVISEGEVYGLADGMKSIYFDKTPVQNKDGSYNFKNVQIEGRAGGQVQDLMAGFNTSEKEVGVGTVVKKNLPITRTVTDSKVSRLRLTIGVQSLFKQEDNGDTNGTSVNFIITIGSRTYPVLISGKYSSQYLQHHTFDNLPSVPFIVKVERTTNDSTTQRLQNNTIWSSYTEIIDTEFAYPNTALMGVKFDSEYFSNIPTRTYDLLGLKVKVPSNYDTRTRKYTGMWDGTFKIDWTDNPAWVLYDVVTNKRYGLGGRLGEFGADKWALYQVAQYCDQLVPDGFGGQEPRFTCNVWLTEQRSAYQVINDICSIFRAMPVWNGQQLTVVMDRPADPVWTYTNANVDESGFSYTFSARKSRHNAIQVEYADKENSYEKAIEYVADDESIRKNGLNVKKITAFGCTSRGQAHRTALWLLQTEKLETKTVTFTVGAEGLMHIPGDIIKVADTHYAGTNIGGRVLAVNGMTVTLDREITISGNSYLSYINANAKHQNIKIISVNGAEVTLDQPPVGLEIYGVWSLTTQQVTSQLFKALSVKEESKGKYTIMALQHEPQKEAIVDNGAKFEPIGTTVLTTPQISNIGVAVNEDGSVSVDSSVTGGNGIVKYDIRIYKGGVLYDVRLGQLYPNLNIDGLENGDYSVLIQVKNENGQLLSEKTQTFTINKPPAPTGVRVTGGLGNITIEWDWVNDATETEIFISETRDIKTARRLTKVTARMYTHEVGAKQVRYYWLRHVRGQNVGAFYQQSGLRGESSVDIDKELKLLNEKLSQNIINEVFDTAAPARKLDLTLTVADIGNTAQYRGHKQVYNEKDGKLYTWNGKKYDSTTTEILASAIKGTIGVDQLAPIPTTKLTGQLNQNQIPNISADKIQGALSLAQVPAIPTTKLTGTIGAYQLQANSIGANLIQANAIGTTHLQSNSVGAQQMQANSIGANAIQANAIGADKLQANSVTAAKIQTGAIRANHVAAGELTADKLAIGLGGNLLYNPIFDNKAYGWSENRGNGSLARQTTRLIRRTSTKFNGLVTNGAVLIAEVWANSDVSSWWNIAEQVVSVVPNQRYCLSAFIDAWQCTGELIVQEIASDGVSWVRNFAFSERKGRNISGYSQSGAMEENVGSIDPLTRNHVFFTAPSSGYVSVVCVMRNIQSGATLKIANPMLEECTEHTREPSPWQNAGVTAIHGGSIITRTITTEQLAANSVTANEIATGAVMAKHVAANSIGANHVATHSLTADKLNVTSLSAISADLGDITGGSININNRFKVSNQGQVEMRANQGNVGLVMNNENIIVYDTSGRPRLKIGKLR